MKHRRTEQDTSTVAPTSDEVKLNIVAQIATGSGGIPYINRQNWCLGTGARKL